MDLPIHMFLWVLLAGSTAAAGAVAWARQHHRRRRVLRRLRRLRPVKVLGARDGPVLLEGRVRARQTLPAILTTEGLVAYHLLVHDRDDTPPQVVQTRRAAVPFALVDETGAAEVHVGTPQLILRRVVDGELRRQGEPELTALGVPRDRWQRRLAFTLHGLGDGAPVLVMGQAERRGAAAGAPCGPAATRGEILLSDRPLTTLITDLERGALDIH